MKKNHAKPVPESGAAQSTPKCPGCGCACSHCVRGVPSFIPENPRYTIDEVLQFVRNFDGPVRSLDVTLALPGMSQEDASNRLRKLLRSGLLRIASRDGREILYRMR